MIKLPLSWICQHNNSDRINSIPFYFEKGNWLSLGMVSHEFNFINYISNYISKGTHSIFIRGINHSTSKILKSKGFEVLSFGKEAILSFDKDHFAKRSIRELINRGFRSGSVKEIPYSPEIEKRLLLFEKETAHGSEPLLQHLYIRGFPKDTRLFVFKSHKDIWLGAIVVSVNSRDKFHTEFLLRKKSAPIGIMEALIFEIFNILKNQHKKFWSLGEVPFILNSEKDSWFSKAILLNRFGHSFSFAYNYNGLYFFKNKFAPSWEPVYLAGYPKVTLRQLFTVSIKSNLFKLVLFKFFQFFNFLETDKTS